MSTVYISIGNSDDKLTQAEWSEFVAEVNDAVKTYCSMTHGKWMSLPHSPWQNACWCVEVNEGAQLYLRDSLRRIAAQYNQDYIAWAVAETEFLRPSHPRRQS